MARDLDAARALVELDGEAEALLTSVARPIVLAPARRDARRRRARQPRARRDAAVHAAAPSAVRVRRAGRARDDEREPLQRADGVRRRRRRREPGGDRGRVPDRRARASRAASTTPSRASRRAGPSVLRRARGLAPQAIATIPSTRPILAVGGDLKNAIALVVDGQAFVSQHVGDLDHVPARDAFDETVRDLCAMYGIREDELLVAHDAHPEYASTAYARAMPGEHVAIQHHRAHVASVLAERGEWDARRARRRVRRHRLRRRRHDLGRRVLHGQRARRFHARRAPARRAAARRRRRGAVSGASGGGVSVRAVRIAGSRPRRRSGFRRGTSTRAR